MHIWVFAIVYTWASSRKLKFCQFICLLLPWSTMFIWLKTASEKQGNHSYPLRIRSGSAEDQVRVSRHLINHTKSSMIPHNRKLKTLKIVNFHCILLMIMCSATVDPCQCHSMDTCQWQQAVHQCKGIIPIVSKKKKRAIYSCHSFRLWSNVQNICAGVTVKALNTHLLPWIRSCRTLPSSAHSDYKRCSHFRQFQLLLFLSKSQTEKAPKSAKGLSTIPISRPFVWCSETSFFLLWTSANHMTIHVVLNPLGFYFG